MASETPTGELNLATISKMKVVEIKKELKARGLSTAGTKTELVERLQSSNTQSAQDLNSEDGNADVEMLDEDEVLGGVEEGGEEEFDDDDDLTSDVVMADQPKVQEPAPTSLVTKRSAPLESETTTQEVQPKKRILVRPMSILSGKENGEQQKNANVDEKKEKPDESEKKIVKLSTVTVKERLELRAQKFGTPLSEDAKKAARAARFGVTAGEQIKATAMSASTKVTFLGPGDDVLRKRAERFGGNVSSLALKVEANDKLKKRQERFGGSTVKANNLEDKKKVRAERFNL